jgi:hypothetical protein
MNHFAHPLPHLDKASFKSHNSLLGWNGRHHPVLAKKAIQFVRHYKIRFVILKLYFLASCLREIKL